MSRVIVVGSTNIDLFHAAESIPGPGETVLAHDSYQALGGKGANQAIAAVRTGARTLFITKLGKDDFGKVAQKELRGFGLPARGIIRMAGAPTGMASIVIDSKGENAITVASGANSKLRPADLRSFINEFKKGDIVLLQMEIPLATNLYVAKQAKRRGCIVMLNPAPAQCIADIRKLLPFVTIATPNEVETRQLTGVDPRTKASAVAAFAKLKRYGLSYLIITRGSRSTLIANDSEVISITPVKAGPAVDTVGAGDTFSGALARGLQKGLPIKEAAHFAAAAAAISVTRCGAATSIPNETEVLRCLRKSR